MYYKKNTILIGDKNKKIDYCADHYRCECCGGSYLLSVHHHIKQNARHLSDRYTIELPVNWSVLCRKCHDIIHNSESEYKRRIVSDKTYSYWHELKSGDSLDVFISGWIAYNE